jgi:hypothetical protein
MACKGKVKVSSEIKDNEVTFVTITSKDASTFKLQNPWGGEDVLVELKGKTTTIQSEIIEIQLTKNDKIKIVKT